MRVPRLITFFIPRKPDAPYNASDLEVTHPADTAVDIEEGTESEIALPEIENGNGANPYISIAHVHSLYGLPTQWTALAGTAGRTELCC